MRNRFSKASDGDDGAALIMAIAFVTLIGLLAAGGLGYAALSLKATSDRYQPNRDRLYAADGAVKVAAAWAATNAAAVKAGVACPVTKTVGTTGRNGADSVVVQMCPLGALFSTTTTGGSDGFGLITTAKGSEDGLVLSVGSKGGLTVNGNVYAASALNIGKNATLTVNGATSPAIQAVGGCTGTGTVVVDGTTVNASTCTVASMPNVDPDYQLPANFTSSAAKSPDLSQCTSKGTGVAVFYPGTYTKDVDDLKTSKCDFVWFTPGVYLIDGSSGGVEWAVKVPMIAGDTSDGTAPTDWSDMGKGCDSTKPGTTFIMAGDASIDLSANGTLQVCGATLNGSKYDIPLYGAKKDLVVSGKVIVRSLCRASSVPSSGCQIISSQGNGNVFWFEGIVYTPYGKIAAKLPNTSLGLSTRGMVVRVLQLQTNASTVSSPVVASDNVAASLAGGSLQVTAMVAGNTWMTCEVVYTTAGLAVASWSVAGCTIPR